KLPRAHERRTRRRMWSIDEANDEEKRARDALTHEAWGAGLTLAQYLEREAALRAHRWPASGSMITWALRGDGGRLLASCETFRMPARLDGAPAGNAYAVASVFTEPALRGRGYAAALTRAVGDELRARDPGACASVLFSDVGAALYERAGYAARPSINRGAPAEPGDPREGVDALFVDDDPAALDGAIAEFFGPPREGFWLEPSGAQLDWHRERERLYARLLGRPALGSWGARRGQGALLWAADWKGGCLNGLFYRAPGAAEAEALLRSMRRVAASVGLARVVLWDDPSQPWPAPFATAPREGGIPMLRPLHPGLRPEAWALVSRGVWV
ncbi:MAG TPA: GNAT family N-acetyltransferase, partial [Polyangiaceae bacterium]|nr:GNAT family N-acetyltransferase [Polyangiaceae bacterium]